MRKLLVVAAILFMAPIAGGMTVSLSDTGTSVELSVVGATYDPYLAMVIQAPGVLSNFAAGPEAPSVNSSFGPVTINGDSGEVWGLGVLPSETYQDGVWLTADWSPFLGCIIAYETLDVGASWILREMLHTHSFPEPMTIALLGLGGILLLRRRHK